MVLVSICSACIQFIWGTDSDLNIVIALVGALLTISIMRLSLLQHTPLSALAVIGCGLFNFVLPLVMTSLEGKSLTHELQRPNLVFGINLLAFGTLITSHAVYRNSMMLQGIRRWIAQALLRPLHMYVAPTPPQLFLLGAIGLGSNAFLTLVLGVKHEDTYGNMLLKTLEGLAFLSYAPYLTLFYPLLGSAPCNIRRLSIPLVV